MRKLLTLLLIITLGNAYAQPSYIADRIVARKTLQVKDYWISGIQRDTALIDSSKLPTSLAVRKFVEGRLAGIGGGGGVGNLQSVTDNGRITTRGAVFEQIAIGADFSGLPSLGMAHILADSTRRSTIFGRMAGYSSSSVGLTAMGWNAAINASGHYITAYGDSAGVNNTFSNVTLIGTKAAADSARQIVLADGVRNLRLAIGNFTNNRKLRFQDADGTVALLHNIPSPGIQLNALSVNAAAAGGSATYNNTTGVFSIPSYTLDGVIGNNPTTDKPVSFDGANGGFGIAEDGNGGFYANVYGPDGATETFPAKIRFRESTIGTYVGSIVPDIEAYGDPEIKMPRTSGRIVISVNGEEPDEDGNVVVSTGGGSWGSISGTLSDQTDLQTALNAKASVSHTHSLDLLTNVDASGKVDNSRLEWNASTSNWEARKRDSTAAKLPLRVKKTTGQKDTIGIWLPPKSMLVNNSSDSGFVQPVSFFDTSGVYSGAITWAGSLAPSGTTSHYFSLSVRGNRASLTVYLGYSAAGTGNNAVTITLPPGAPLPLIPPGLGGANEYLPYSAAGFISTAPTGSPTTGRALMKMNNDASGVEIVTTTGAVAARNSFFSLDYTIP